MVRRSGFERWDLAIIEYSLTKDIYALLKRRRSRFFKWLKLLSRVYNLCMRETYFLALFKFVTSATILQRKKKESCQILTSEGKKESSVFRLHPL